MPILLTTAANGHLWLQQPDLDESAGQTWCAELQRRYNLQRSGQRIISPDETIEPDLIGTNFALLVGWDGWVGYYLLAQCPRGDTWLRALAAAMGADTAEAD